MSSDSHSAPPTVAFSEGRRGLNALQVFVVFALVLGVVMLGLTQLDSLSGVAVEVDRLYSDASGVRSRLPIAKASEGPVQLNAAARQQLSEANQVTRLHDRQILEDETLEGLFIVEPGARVVLRNVTLRGALVSAAQLDGGVESPSWVILQGSVRIAPGDVIPGLAVMLPRGSLLADESDSVLQIHGDIVAQRVELLGEAHLFGEILSTQQPVLSDRVEKFSAEVPVAQLSEPSRNESDYNALTSFEFP